MCGIAGFISASRRAPDEVLSVQAMTDAQRHRGPDDEGLKIIRPQAPMAIFGHRRLAIIETSRAGRQPMFDEETGNYVTFNGEIYNFQSLRQRLEQEGQRFRTQTDTEVILKAYAAWGEGCVNYLRGIFAFALWDDAERGLFVARDQLGVKPLYCWENHGDFLFASEVRALLASGLVPRRLDPQGLRSYLAFGSVQEPLTLIEGVKSLLPGHTLFWRDGVTTRRRYWRLPKPEARQDEGLTNVTKQTGGLLQEAVKLQMIADVPLGAFLSGGIDSTAVAALMQRAAGRRVSTFAVVFDEAEYDEREYSKLAASHIGTQHAELSLTGDLVKAELPRALAAFDQPSVDGLNTYFVSKVTREAGLTVALSGVGGDELFGGYNGFSRTLQVMKWGGHLQSLPVSMRLQLQKVLEAIQQREDLRKLSDLLANGQHPYFVSRRLFSGRQVKDILESSLHARGAGWRPPVFEELIEENRDYDPINFISAMELQTYMLSTLLRDTDQMSMAHALEVRVPLLDHKLVEYMFTFSGRYKIDVNTPKPILTGALNGLIPRDCIFRPKRGFTLPFEHWLRNALMRSIELTFHGGDSDLFVPESLRRLWAQFQSNKVSWSRVWSIFVLRDWLNRHEVVPA